MEFPGKSRIIAGIISIGLSMGLLVYGGNKLGKYSDIQSNLLLKKVDAVYFDKETSQEDFEITAKELTRGSYAVGFGLAGLIFGMLIGGASGISRYDIKKRKRKKTGERDSYSQFEGRFRRYEGGVALENRFKIE